MGAAERSSVSPFFRVYNFPFVGGQVLLRLREELGGKQLIGLGCSPLDCIKIFPGILKAFQFAAVGFACFCLGVHQEVKNTFHLQACVDQIFLELAKV